jgi:hypothetical protein
VISHRFSSRCDLIEQDFLADGWNRLRTFCMGVYVEDNVISHQFSSSFELIENDFLAEAGIAYVPFVWAST